MRKYSCILCGRTFGFTKEELEAMTVLAESLDGVADFVKHSSLCPECQQITTIKIIPIPTMIAGIVTDNFKLEKFKNELTAKEFTYTVHPHGAGMSLIKVSIVTPQEKLTLAKLCKEVELHFKRRN